MSVPPEKHLKTVKIPVRIVNGIIELKTGGHLPQIEECTSGYLIVPEDSIKDHDIRLKLSQHDSKELLIAKTKLLMIFSRHQQVKYNTLTEEYIKETSHRYLESYVLRSFTFPSSIVAEVILLGDLRISLHGTKLAALEPCMCESPLLDQEAESLNHAYTLLSEILEPKRLSHTGNVFLKTLYQTPDLIWHQIDDLRYEYEKNVEIEIIKKTFKSAQSES